MITVHGAGRKLIGVNNMKTVRLKIVAYANFIDVNRAQAEVIKAWNQRIEEEKK